MNCLQFSSKLTQVSRRCSTVELLIYSKKADLNFILLESCGIWTKMYCGTSSTPCKNDVPCNKSLKKKSQLNISLHSFTLVFIMPPPLCILCTMQDFFKVKFCGNKRYTVQVYKPLTAFVGMVSGLTLGVCGCVFHSGIQ